MTVQPPYGPPAPPTYPGGYPSPGYGYPVPGYGYPAPPTHSGSGRKKLLRIAAALLTLATILGGLGLWAMSGIFKAQPTPENRFDSGGSVDVVFAAGETKYIYGQTHASLHDMRCTASGSGVSGGGSMDTLTTDIRINDWQGLMAVTVEQAGTYTVTCSGHGGDVFGVGEPITGGHFALPVGALGLAGVCALSGVVTGIVGLAKK